jgi:tetratricopeptide (TPR) repeat protein
MRRLVILAVIVISVAASAQNAPAHIIVDVDVRATAVEQLRVARELAEKIDKAVNETERQRAIVTALGHLEAVVMKWPRDARAVADARLLQYDIAMRFQMPQNAAEFMEKAEALELNEGERASLHRKKAAAFALLGRDAEAEAAFAQAEKRQPNATDFERQAFLQERANFASSRGKHAEASRYLRKLAALPGIQPATRMMTLLMSLDENDRAGDRVAMKNDYRDLMRIYDAEKMKSPADEADLEVRKVIASALDRHRND